ncbi:BnaC01g28800D [Brassica napus]|uniref:(rape) hypothetical protein n=1 Tax=Brassica napus TaxID=3708 RepID=A0A078H6F1_BRANA|nr:unnamed protein product [Brassica napus]CDY34140.1 BnaC01g28800D [Brassica napus]
MPIHQGVFPIGKAALNIFQLLIVNLYQLQILHLKFLLKSSLTINLECELLHARRWDLDYKKDESSCQFSENDHAVGSSIESWKMQSKRGFPETDYPGNDIPGAGAVTTKLS